MKKKILLLTIISIFGFMRVNALTYGGCNYSTISRLKSLVTNINISYDYHINDDKAYFDVTLTNITPGMYFVDMTTDITYTYKDTIDGEITIRNYTNQSGSYKFYSETNECDSIPLGTKYYKFPIYNTYYTNPLCADIPNFSLCQKWTYVSYSYDKFELYVQEYKDSLNKIPPKEENVEYNKNFLDIIVDLYIRYYYYLFIVIILICGSIIFMKQRNDKFKL